MPQFCPNCASTDIRSIPVDGTEQQGSCGGCGAAWRMTWLDGGKMQAIREFDPNAVQEPYGDARAEAALRFGARNE